MRRRQSGIAWRYTRTSGSFLRFAFDGVAAQPATRPRGLYKMCRGSASLPPGELCAHFGRCPGKQGSRAAGPVAHSDSGPFSQYPKDLANNKSLS